jgi:hypothetical protein
MSGKAEPVPLLTPDSRDVRRDKKEESFGPKAEAGIYQGDPGERAVIRERSLN